MQLKRGRCREGALAPGRLPSMHKADERVSVLGPLRRWRVLEVLEVLVRHLRRPASNQGRPAHQSSRAPSMKILVLTLTLTLTHRLPGFRFLL